MNVSLDELSYTIAYSVLAATMHSQNGEQESAPSNRARAIADQVAAAVKEAVSRGSAAEAIYEDCQELE